MMIEDKLTQGQRIRLEAIAQANMAGLNGLKEKLKIASAFEEFIINGVDPDGNYDERTLDKAVNTLAFDVALGIDVYRAREIVNVLLNKGFLIRERS